MWLLLTSLLTLPILSTACFLSVTSASGTHAEHFYCSGELIFSEEFHELDFEKWQHENTLSGGGVS